MIAILDYGAGNQTSVRRALDSQGLESVVTADPHLMLQAEGLIFPGVGAAGQAMRHLRSSGLDTFLREWVAASRPMLGVCLGSQIMLEYSEENDMTCLGLLPGKTRLFDAALREEDGSPIAIPHMGWNGVRLEDTEAARACPLFDGIAPNTEFYFVHSYYTEPAPENVIASTFYGQRFCSVLGREGLWATQFHTEKSGPAGLRLLRNFCAWCHNKAASGQDNAASGHNKAAFGQGKAHSGKVAGADGSCAKGAAHA
jgi:glutamine amidotransferase